MTITHDLDAHVLVADGVHVVRWPEQEAWRRTLETARIPRVLLVDADASPPEDWDELEDWIRLPLDPDELQARARAVSLRARGMSRPVVDAEGICWVEDRWVDLSPPQVLVTEMLVASFGDLVLLGDIVTAIEEAGASAAPSARKAMLARLRRRLAPLGLVLHNVRDRGYLLDWERGVDATRPSDDSTAA